MKERVARHSMPVFERRESRHHRDAPVDALAAEFDFLAAYRQKP